MNNNSKVNFNSKDNVELLNLDVADFFEHYERKIDYMINDGSIQT